MIIVMIMRTRTAAVAEVAEEAAVEAEWWWRWSFVIEQTCVSRASGRGGGSGSNVIRDTMLTQVTSASQASISMSSVCSTRGSLQCCLQA